MTIILIVIYATRVFCSRCDKLVYVCLCNGITENQIRDAVVGGAASLHDLGASLGVATCCGQCAECAQQVIHETQSSGGSALVLQAV